jgi:hypothetical protein
MWPTATAPPTNLNPVPGGNTGGQVSAMAASRQYGSWGGQAAMWSGTAASYANLNPTGSLFSGILAASSTQQAGWTRASAAAFGTATLWSGSAASAISLAPVGSSGSFANAMTESHQGGQVRFPGQPGQGSILHAALWNGTAASFVDMNPPGYASSSIAGMFGDQQVGSGQAANGAPERAAMWFGTPESHRTMHPFPTGLSQIAATCGSAQVGYVNSANFGAGQGVRAAIWFGTAESVLDLSQFLPAGHGTSIATCIEERNGVYTIGGYVRYGFEDQAFVWVGVPAPGTAVVMAGAGLIAIRRRRSHA